MNNTFLNAIAKKPIPHTPVWIMRQAGRYLPEYQATRAKAGSFLKLCKTPELAAEVTLQPVRRFGMDAAILFSDILTIPDAMGLGLHFVEGEGPHFEKTLRNASDIEALPVPEPEEALAYVTDTIRLLRPQLEVPLIGFAGSPWTLAAYMLEGGPPGEFKQTKAMLYDHPALLHTLLRKLGESVQLYLSAQIEAGVDCVMLFDTWGGVLSEPAYQAFSLFYMEKIIEGLSHRYPELPTILFTKGSGAWLHLYQKSAASVIGLDWQTSIAKAKMLLGHDYALQGNLDPAILRSSDAVIEREVARILADFGGNTGHIFNLGHGITPDIDPEKVKVLVECVHRTGCDDLRLQFS